MAAAVLPAVVVWNLDRLEELAEPVSDGGPASLLFAVVAFILAWLPGWGPLVIVSRRPGLDGLLAGGLVAGSMAVLMVRIVTDQGPGLWPLVLIIGLPFYALAVGCGAASGLAARRLRGETSSVRGAAVACIAAGVVLLGVPFAFFRPLISWMFFAPVILAALLICAGTLALLPRGGPPAKP